MSHESRAPCRRCTTARNEFRDALRFAARGDSAAALKKLQGSPPRKRGPPNSWVPAFAGTTSAPLPAARAEQREDERRDAALDVVVAVGEPDRHEAAEHHPARDCVREVLELLREHFALFEVRSHFH